MCLDVDTKYVSLAAFDWSTMSKNIPNDYATVQSVMYALQPTSPSCDMNYLLVHCGAAGNIFCCVDKVLSKHCRHKEKCLLVCVWAAASLWASGC